MTRKRLVVILGAMLACVGVALIVLATLPRAPGVTKANFDRIEIGMTKEQVEEILGPQDDYSAYTNSWTFTVSSGSNGVCNWRSVDGARAEIRFHQEACLGCTVHAPAAAVQKTWYASEETSLKRIRRWLGQAPGSVPVAPVALPAPAFLVVPPPSPPIP